MNILHIQLAKDLKPKFRAGLQISGVEDGEILWVGSMKQWSNIK